MRAAAYDLILALLQACGGTVDKIDFQKLLFLYTREVEDEPTFEFLPYRYGCFSFTSYRAVSKLRERGLIDEGDNTLQLTGQGEQAASANPSAEQMADVFVRTRAGLRGDALVAYVYQEYPFFAIRSRLVPSLRAKGLLGPNAEAKISQAKPACVAHELVTLGYEGISVEAYFQKLLAAGVTILVDVRKNPLSRKYGFSKKALGTIAEAMGIRYEHLPQLGIPSTARKHLHSREDYRSLFTNYRRSILPRQQNAIRQIAAWVEAGECVALTCFENDHEMCHRHCVFDEVVKRLGSQTAVRHLA